MIILEKDSQNAKEALKFIEECQKEAWRSTCERSKCGSLIVKDGEILGRGVNTPPGNLESERRCQIKKSEYDLKVTDKTCCVHAEERAIINALKNFPDKLVGSRLYFVRLDKDNEISFASEPYCTICSKMALDTGIKEFVLYHAKGIYVYDTEEYNNLSFNYQE